MSYWLDLFEELRRTCPDKYEHYYINAGPRDNTFKEKNVALDEDFNSIIFTFTDKFKDKYRVTVRAFVNNSVNVTVEIKGNGNFEYPVTYEDELFDKRLDFYGPSDVKGNPSVRTELKEIYDWTFNAYRNL